MEPGDRKRVTQACEQCKTSRRRCDSGHPCTMCSKKGLPCTYSLQPPAKRGPKPRAERLAAEARGAAPAERLAAEARRGAAPGAAAPAAAAAPSRPTSLPPPSAPASRHAAAPASSKPAASHRARGLPPADPQALARQIEELRAQLAAAEAALFAAQHERRGGAAPGRGYTHGHDVPSDDDDDDGELVDDDDEDDEGRRHFTEYPGEPLAKVRRLSHGDVSRSRAHQRSEGSGHRQRVGALSAALMMDDMYGEDDGADGRGAGYSHRRGSSSSGSSQDSTPRPHEPTPGAEEDSRGAKKPRLSKPRGAAPAAPSAPPSASSATMGSPIVTDMFSPPGPIVPTPYEASLLEAFFASSNRLIPIVDEALFRCALEEARHYSAPEGTAVDALIDLAVCGGSSSGLQPEPTAGRKRRRSSDPEAEGTGSPVPALPAGPGPALTASNSAFGIGGGGGSGAAPGAPALSPSSIAAAFGFRVCYHTLLCLGATNVGDMPAAKVFYEKARAYIGPCMTRPSLHLVSALLMMTFITRALRLGNEECFVMASLAQRMTEVVATPPEIRVAAHLLCYTHTTSSAMHWPAPRAVVQVNPQAEAAAEVAPAAAAEAPPAASASAGATPCSRCTLPPSKAPASEARYAELVGFFLSQLMHGYPLVRTAEQREAFTALAEEALELKEATGVLASFPLKGMLLACRAQLEGEAGDPVAAFNLACEAISVLRDDPLAANCFPCYLAVARIMVVFPRARRRFMESGACKLPGFMARVKALRIGAVRFLSGFIPVITGQPRSDEDQAVDDTATLSAIRDVVGLQGCPFAEQQGGAEADVRAACSPCEAGPCGGAAAAAPAACDSATVQEPCSEASACEAGGCDLPGGPVGAVDPFVINMVVDASTLNADDFIDQMSDVMLSGGKAGCAMVDNLFAKNIHPTNMLTLLGTTSRPHLPPPVTAPPQAPAHGSKAGAAVGSPVPAAAAALPGSASAAFDSSFIPRIISAPGMHSVINNRSNGVAAGPGSSSSSSGGGASRGTTGGRPAVKTGSSRDPAMSATVGRPPPPRNIMMMRMSAALTGNSSNAGAPSSGGAAREPRRSGLRAMGLPEVSEYQDVIAAAAAAGSEDDDDDVGSGGLLIPGLLDTDPESLAGTPRFASVLSGAAASSSSSSGPAGPAARAEARGEVTGFAPSRASEGCQHASASNMSTSCSTCSMSDDASSVASAAGSDSSRTSVPLVITHTLGAMSVSHASGAGNGGVSSQPANAAAVLPPPPLGLFGMTPLSRTGSLSDPYTGAYPTPSSSSTVQPQGGALPSRITGVPPLSLLRPGSAIPAVSRQPSYEPLQPGAAHGGGSSGAAGQGWSAPNSARPLVPHAGGLDANGNASTSWANDQTVALFGNLSKMFDKAQSAGVQPGPTAAFPADFRTRRDSDAESVDSMTSTTSLGLHLSIPQLPRQQ